MSEPTAAITWERLAHALAPEILALVERAVRIAEEQQQPIYLVGGPVRDLLLRQPITDIDLVVEGDAWTIAEAFQAETGGKLTKHAAFRTAAVEIALGSQPFVIDFVTARRESYPTPAALPVVTPAHIHDDLRRRDFTINTLALRLTSADATLLDPFAGQQDLRAGLVRVLHDESFIDDPTRILRGVRFAARFAFVVEPHTTALVGAALAENMIARTSSQRILHELWLLLAEQRPEQALLLLHEWGAFPQLELLWSSDWLAQFPAARAAAWPDLPLLGFGLLIWPMNQTQRAAFATRYNLPTAERKLLHELPFAVPPALDQPELSAVEL
ncbi:MAG: CCA tRNA nucleotidyltransferase, partial [Chloroflexi bacterium]|nr:CCA tRNA nucleotidyltransferase [Chloroflexota bacterium]